MKIEQIKRKDERGYVIGDDKISMTIPQDNHRQYVTVRLNGIVIEIEPDCDEIMISTDKDSIWISKDGTIV